MLKLNIMARALLLGGSIFADAGSSEQRLEELRARQQTLIQASADIVAAADADNGRDLTPEEIASITANETEVAKLAPQIQARAAAVNAARPGGRRSDAEPGVPAGAAARVNPRGDAAKHGFKSFGEFAMTVRAAAGNKPDAVQRFQNVASTYGNEGEGADGGFAVPPEMRTTIWQKVTGEDSLFLRTDQLVTASNSMTIPKDETTPWQSSGGVLAYWESEAGQVVGSKPQLALASIRLNKLMALVPVSEELLEDAPGLDSYLRAKAPMKMQAKLNTAIISGTGVGQPLGILNSPSLISVAKQASQPADSLWYLNVSQMWNRLYAPLRRNAVWLINQDVEPQLDIMEFSPGSTVPIPVYLPAGGISAAPYATLKGRPVIPVEACSTVGTKGDIILTDLSQYMSLTKGTDIKTDISMHLYFDQGLMAYRFTFRVAGQPWWGSNILPQNGSTTRTWAVSLDTRA